MVDTAGIRMVAPEEVRFPPVPPLPFTQQSAKGLFVDVQSYGIITAVAIYT